MIDPDFPLNDQTVGKKNYSWKSFSGYPLFPEVLTSFPKQGKLGNCYWISPLVSIYAVKPQQIQSLFLEQDQNFIHVQLCVDGEWQTLIIDHYFPFNDQKNKVAYCKLVDGSLWAMALEKAWAKIYSSYSQIGGGFNRTTLKVLTGAPTNKFRTRDEKFPQILYEIGKYRFPAGANSKKQQTDNIFAKNHAYSILNIEENCIVVRNPWGKKNRDQHTLTFAEFRERFASVECCYHYDNYQYESQRVTCNKEPIYFEINIEEPGNYFFTINQQNKRNFRKLPSIKYKYSPCSITLQCGKVINYQKHESNKELWINWNFAQPCKVFVVCQIEWKCEQVNTFVYNTYGPRYTQKQVFEIPVIQNQEIQGFRQFDQRDAEKEQEEEELNLNQQIQQVEINENQQNDRKSCGWCAIY